VTAAGPPFSVVGVVGAGTMGAGIAQVALEAGHEVVLYDVDSDARARGRERVRDGLARRASRLDLDAEAIDDWVAGRAERLRDAHTLEAIGAEAGLGLVVEAALEDLELKQDVFRALDAASPARVILATNTSALSVAEIAEATRHPARVLGLHFFNPAPLMPLVEVVATPLTDRRVVDRARDVIEAWGKTPVVAGDSPGFIVNRVNRPFTLEALRMVEAGEASIERIDRAIRDAGYPMGPFELMDLIGLDVNLATTTEIWRRSGEPERLRPSLIQARLVEAGQLGRKAGSGFYDYDGGQRRAAELPFPGVAEAPDELPDDAIVARIRAAILGEARLAVAEGVADEDAIDLALKLGAGHPAGPFEQDRATT
jgi:3-hydroxybutyryl-CoA dehydrogenase